jgi:hypothetical protein
MSVDGGDPSRFETMVQAVEHRPVVVRIAQRYVLEDSRVAAHQKRRLLQAMESAVATMICDDFASPRRADSN